MLPTMMALILAAPIPEVPPASSADNDDARSASRPAAVGSSASSRRAAVRLSAPDTGS